jgi:hypothetical protein
MIRRLRRLTPSGPSSQRDDVLSPSIVSLRDPSAGPESNPARSSTHPLANAKGPSMRALLRLAERAGFEPAKRGYRLLAFQASAFDHSATSPDALAQGRRRLAQPSARFKPNPFKLNLLIPDSYRKSPVDPPGTRPSGPGPLRAPANPGSSRLRPSWVHRDPAVPEPVRRFFARDTHAVPHKPWACSRGRRRSAPERSTREPII